MYRGTWLASVSWPTYFSYLAYLCVLGFLSILAYFSNLAYFCVLAYFSYLACLTQYQIVNDKFFDNVFKYLRLSTISHKKSLTDELNLNYLAYKTWASINDWTKRFHLLIHFLSTLPVEKCFVLPTTIHFRGGSRIFFRRGCTRLLLYFNTNKPHSFFFAEYQLY